MDRSGNIKREEFAYLFCGKLRLLSHQEAEALLGVLDRYVYLLFSYHLYICTTWNGERDWCASIGSEVLLLLVTRRLSNLVNNASRLLSRMQPLLRSRSIAHRQHAHP